MDKNNTRLYHVTSICWDEKSDIDINELPKSCYVHVPTQINKVHRYIDSELLKTKSVKPWYYNLDFVTNDNFKALNI